MGIQTKNLSTARLLMSMHRFFNVQNVSRIYNPNSVLSWQRIYTSCNTKKNTDLALSDGRSQKIGCISISKSTLWDTKKFIYLVGA